MLSPIMQALAEGLARAKPTSAEDGYARWASTVISVTHAMEGHIWPFAPVEFMNAAGLGAFRD